MRDARTYDAVVIGAGVNGLAAATYLAMAGKRVLVLEARDRLGGACETEAANGSLLYSKAAHALYALDPYVIKELKLARHGLKFAVRDMALVGLRADGRHVVLSRDVQASARRIGIHSESDAQIWPQFRREWYGMARKLRTLWWQAGSNTAETVLDDDRLQHLAAIGSAAWLDSQLEAEALKATLGFDAHALSPLAAGSALVLFWRAAQEMCGLQAAVAAPEGGLRTVADAFAGSARAVGVETQTGSSVADILVTAEGTAGGVVLTSGETIAASLVLSSLSRLHTLSYKSIRTAPGLAAIAETGRLNPGTSMARVTLALDTCPKIAGASVPLSARFVVIDRLESLVAAHAASRAGRLPQELTMEMIMPSAVDSALASTGRHLISTLVGPVPQRIAGGWHVMKPILAAKVVSTLARHIPGIGRYLVAVEVLTPEDVHGIYGADDAFGGGVDVPRLLADWRARVRTPIPGLVLCGACADPVGAVSGRGGRAAASFIFEREAGRDV